MEAQIFDTDSFEFITILSTKTTKPVFDLNTDLKLDVSGLPPGSYTLILYYGISLADSDEVRNIQVKTGQLDIIAEAS